MMADGVAKLSSSVAIKSLIEVGGDFAAFNDVGDVEQACMGPTGAASATIAMSARRMMARSTLCAK